MRRLLSIFQTAALGVAFAPLAGSAWEHHGRQACEPGYTIVQEICYKEVCKKVCKVVPDVKKTTKWVYDCRTEDFCVKKCTLGHHGGPCGQCASCTQCDRPTSRNLLVKRLVVEECPTEKCVVETIVERVPYVVYRKVPCAAPGATPETVPAPKATMPPETLNKTPGGPGILPVAGPALVPTVVEVTPPAPRLAPEGLPVLPSPAIPLGQ